MTNPLLSPSTLPLQLPDYARLTDAHYRDGLIDGMREHLDKIHALAHSAEPATVEIVLHAWESSGATLTRTGNAFTVARSAHTTPERDAIASEFATRFAEHSDAIQLDHALYERFVELQRRADAGEVELDEQDRWLLTKRLREHQRAGVALPDAVQERLRDLNGRLAVLEDQFEQTLIKGRNAASVHVTDEAELAGVPDDERAALAESAKAAGLSGWLINIVNTTGQPILDSLENRELRERIFLASTERGLSGEYDTRDIVVQIARLRAERAQLLGYDHPAAYEHEDSCAGSTAAVNDLLARVAPGVVALAEAEAAPLRERLASIDPDATFEPWDWQYLAAAQAGEAGVDPELLKPYLEYTQVLTRGVFAAATALYGITFHERDDLVGYTPESTVYEVHEEDGTLLGGVILDPYTRPTKRGGAWMTSIVDQSHLFGDLPVVTNTCDVPPPAPGAPSLMTWDNVITLFHEFGHDLHGLLSDVRYPSCSGTAVPRDFVEFPSQVNELWAYEPAIISQFAVHHETGEPIPAEWVDALVAGRQSTAFHTLELLKAMVVDQAWHQSSLDDLPQDGEGVEAFEAAALDRAGLSFPLIPPRYRSAYFSHVFGGGYSAGYYSYLWSEVMDADAAAWFAEQDAHGTGAATRAAGERFRRELLAPGGSVEAMTTFRRFRGADPDVAHLLRRIGLG